MCARHANAAACPPASRTTAQNPAAGLIARIPASRQRTPALFPRAPASIGQQSKHAALQHAAENSIARPTPQPAFSPTEFVLRLREAQTLTSLNIREYLRLTNSVHPRIRFSCLLLKRYDYLYLFKTFLLYCIKIEKHPSGLQNWPNCAPGALIWRHGGAHSRPESQPAGGHP